MSAPKRNIRIDNDPWLPAQRRAALEHRTVSDVIRVALRAYAEGRYDAIEPARTKP